MCPFSFLSGGRDRPRSGGRDRRHPSSQPVERSKPKNFNKHWEAFKQEAMQPPVSVGMRVEEPNCQRCPNYQRCKDYLIREFLSSKENVQNVNFKVGELTGTTLAEFTAPDEQATITFNKKSIDRALRDDGLEEFLALSRTPDHEMIHFKNHTRKGSEQERSEDIHESIDELEAYLNEIKVLIERYMTDPAINVRQYAAGRVKFITEYLRDRYITEQRINAEHGEEIRKVEAELMDSAGAGMRLIDEAMATLELTVVSLGTSESEVDWGVVSRGGLASQYLLRAALNCTAASGVMRNIQEIYQRASRPPGISS